MNVLDYIGTGRENAVTRQELVRRMGLPDRKVREMIECARRDGALIVNLGDGYYVASDVAEIERQYRQDKRRALSILYRAKAMRKILKEAGVDV